MTIIGRCLLSNHEWGAKRSDRGGGWRLVNVLLADPVVVVNAALVVQKSNEAELRMLTTQTGR